MMPKISAIIATINNTLNRIVNVNLDVASFCTVTSPFTVVVKSGLSTPVIVKIKYTKNINAKSFVI